MNYKYTFTIATACYNSSPYIHRVYKSLKTQTFKDFEWLVVDDCSTDNTVEIIKKFQKENAFPIRLIVNEKNMNINANWNTFGREANGKFMCIFDHDDESKPETLQAFFDVWKKYDRPDIADIRALCEDQYGNLVGEKYPEDEFISDYFYVYFTLGMEYERFSCFKTSVFNEFPIDLNEWPGAMEAKHAFTALKYKTIFINKILRIYYLREENKNNLSKGGRLTDPESVFRWYTYWVNSFQYRVKGNWKLRIRKNFAHTFYGLLSKKSIREIIGSVKKWSNKSMCIFYYPIALMVYTYLFLNKKL